MHSDSHSKRCCQGSRGLFIVYSALLVSGLALQAYAVIPAVLSDGEVLKDARLEPLKGTYSGYFPFEVPPTQAEWAQRSERVRTRLRVALGLWPLPQRTPLNPVIHGRVGRDTHTVEKVYFESYPGFYVTGSLYRPRDARARMPGVLCPHGHWNNGRFMTRSQKELDRELVQGAERFDPGGNSPLQSRCAQLARMGCVVFHFDMIGYADSQQISSEIAHRFKQQRPEMNTAESWGLYSARAESHLQTIMGLQTWNAIRALDFVSALPDVDSKRLAVTGASGGGTQTFILGAIDPRPAVVFPACMVGTAMQGGCTCENAAHLRVNTGNVEIAALFAPKPLGLSAADDWTKEMTTKGFPELQKLYALLGSPENVTLTSLTHFGHNYNYVSRGAMYNWFNRHLRLGLDEPVVEQDYRPLTIEEMTVWDQEHPAPQDGPAFERGLVQWMTQDSDKQVKQARKSLAAYRDMVSPALEVMIGRTLSEVGELRFEMSGQAERAECNQVWGLLHHVTQGEKVPMIRLRPRSWLGRSVIWTDLQGKSGLCQANGAVRPEIRRLLSAGIEVIGMDLFLQGEWLAQGQNAEVRKIDGDRDYAGFTFGYNPTVFARRVHDLLTVIAYLKTQPDVEALGLIGLNGAGHWAGVARALAGQTVDIGAIDTAGFRFGDVTDIYDVDFLPGGAKYGDLPGLMALSAPAKLWLAGEGSASGIRALYQKAHAETKLEVNDGAPAGIAQAAVDYVLREWK